MAITNGYCTLAELKSVMRINDTVDDTMLEARITEASRVIDQHCDRRFYADANATARLYVPPVADLVMVDDISTTTGLVIKTDSLCVMACKREIACKAHTDMQAAGDRL